MYRYLRDEVDKFESELNMPLINKEADKSLVEYIVDSFKSMCVLKQLKFKGYDYNEDESTIDINDYIMTRKGKKKKGKKNEPIKQIADSRCGVLTVYFDIEIKDPVKDGNKDRYIRKSVSKSMLIPIIDDDGFMYIEGQRYFMIYQMTEKSTYVQKNNVVLKSLMPVTVERSTRVVTATNGAVFNLPLYSVKSFKAPNNIMLYFATRGFTYALAFLGVDKVVRFVEEPSEEDNWLSFKISSTLYVEANATIFTENRYVQSIIAMIVALADKGKYRMENLEDKNFWIMRLSSNTSNYATPEAALEKGMRDLVSFNRMVDESLKKELKIDRINKDSIYDILRWIMLNYNELRKKDNMDINNKRLRCNEYIASLMTLEISKKLRRTITLGARATMENYLEMFKFNGNILLTRLHDSGILRFDSNINDMTFWSKLKYTIKGPHAVGNKNKNNVSAKLRGNHPSQLGYIDLITCGNSDPGTSGLLSPFNKMEGFYFDDSKDVDSGMFDLKREIEQAIEKCDDEVYIDIICEDKDEYYNCLDKLRSICENTNISGEPIHQIEITDYTTGETTEESDEIDDIEDSDADEQIE